MLKKLNFIEGNRSLHWEICVHVLTEYVTVYISPFSLLLVDKLNKLTVQLLPVHSIGGITQLKLLNVSVFPKHVRGKLLLARICQWVVWLFFPSGVAAGRLCDTSDIWVGVFTATCRSFHVICHQCCGSVPGPSVKRFFNVKMQSSGKC